MIYLDSSLMVSLYCPDANSAAAVAALRTAKAPLIVSALCELETMNAFALRVFRKELTNAQADSARQNLEKDLRDGAFLTRELPEAACARAHKLSKLLTATLGTRTADLLHVAAAVESGATGFFSFDLQQRKMAQAAGLKLNRWP
ncbi:MAG TPA: type II toxin-antitoxin system VapC family toxin [Terracidiphilus sp.]|jgi:predicted nucleic acid-binding protein|nr:type II toxin-antitoxin system VapC family toxin [Terracidiphilus sp.]